MGAMNDLVSATYPEHAVDTLLGLYERLGRTRYDESVTQEEHALQCAQLAIEADATPSMVAAALLHDVGHLLVARERVPTTDLHHEAEGARTLARWFGPEVTRPIALHVAAKRYLCAVDPTYAEGLSPGSVRSLELQGGPMADDEVERFAAMPGAADATELRRWDDLAKVSGRPTKELADHRDLLLELARA